jgi:hypothetical protein
MRLLAVQLESVVKKFASVLIHESVLTQRTWFNDVYIRAEYKQLVAHGF